MKKRKEKKEEMEIMGEDTLPKEEYPEQENDLLNEEIQEFVKFG